MTDLFLIRLGYHITRHIPYALVDDLCHGRHDPLCLGAIEAFSLETLDKVVGVKVELAARLARGYLAAQTCAPLR